MKWEEKFKVKFHECNTNEIVGASQTFKYIQEAAMCQLNSEKPTYNDLLKQGKAFILSAIRVEMYYPVYAYEKITARSWACPSKGVSFIRSYELERDGEIVCEAVSSWALVDVNDRKLLRVDDVDLSNYSTDEVIKTEHPMRIRIPSALPMSLVGEYTVRYSDTDLNGHVNNTNYADILCNCIPGIEQLRVKSVGINYVSDAKKDDELKIYMSKIDGKFYFRTIRSDGKTNVEAEIITERLD
ncbi:MAG: hypothetical protein IJY41_00775 [Clostridia bacterium]|nr:hypothetical protein [Clostridia bacterium]